MRARLCVSVLCMLVSSMWSRLLLLEYNQSLDIFFISISSTKQNNCFLIQTDLFQYHQLSSNWFTTFMSKSHWMRVICGLKHCLFSIPFVFFSFTHIHFIFFCVTPSLANYLSISLSLNITEVEKGMTHTRTHTYPIKNKKQTAFICQLLRYLDFIWHLTNQKIKHLNLKLTRFAFSIK